MQQEQNDEIEVLKSIFPDEFELVSENPWSFKLYLSPNPGSSSDNHVALALVCTFPPEYPLELPNVSIEALKGLGKKHVEEVLCLIMTTARDNMGSPSIFSISEVVKEWLQDHNLPGQDGSMYADMMRKQNEKVIETKKKADKVATLMAAEMDNRKDEESPEELERIRKRQAGHPVTLESFNAWKEKFEAELLIAKTSSNLVVINMREDDRPTGKQLFLSNKATQESEEALIAEGEKELASAPPVDDESKGLGEINDEIDDDEDDEDYVYEGDDDSANEDFES